MAAGAEVLIGVPMDDGRCGWGAVIRVPRSGPRTRARRQPSKYILAQIWQVVSQKAEIQGKIQLCIGKFFLDLVLCDKENLYRSNIHKYMY